MSEVTRGAGSGFWAGGAGAQRKLVRQWHAEQLARLERDLSLGKLDEKEASLERDRLRAEYDRRLKEIDGLLF